MSITNKMQKIGKFFGDLFNKNKVDCYGDQNTSILSQEAMIALFEKYKGVRRIILVIVLWINISIFFTTTRMYKTQTTVDTQWVIFAGYWATILGTFIGFYTMARGKEFKSETPYSSAGEWVAPEILEPETDDCDRIELDGDKLVEGELNEHI